MLHASDDACNAEQLHLSAAIRGHVRGPNFPHGRHARRTLATRGAVLLLLAVVAHEVTGGTGGLAVGRGAGWSEWRDQHAIFSLARSRDRRAPRCLALSQSELDLPKRRARALFAGIFEVVANNHILLKAVAVKSQKRVLTRF